MPRISVREKLERARLEQERQDQALEEESDTSDAGHTNRASNDGRRPDNVTHSGQKSSGSDSSDEDRSRAGSSGSDAIDSASGDEETNGQTGHNEELKTHSPPATVENDSEDVKTQDRNEKQNSVEASVSVQQSDTDILERSELDSIETKHGLSTGAPERSVPKNPQWSKEEHARFLEAMHFYHRDWRRISLHVRSKTVSESRMHASK